MWNYPAIDYTFIWHIHFKEGEENENKAVLG